MIQILRRRSPIILYRERGHAVLLGAFSASSPPHIFNTVLVFVSRHKQLNITDFQYAIHLYNSNDKIAGASRGVTSD